MKVRADLAIVKQNTSLLQDLLRNLGPDEKVRDNELINDIAETCEQMQKRVMKLCEQVENEDLIVELFSVNDVLNGQSSRASLASFSSEGVFFGRSACVKSTSSNSILLHHGTAHTDAQNMFKLRATQESALDQARGNGHQTPVPPVRGAVPGQPISAARLMGQEELPAYDAPSFMVEPPSPLVSLGGGAAALRSNADGSSAASDGLSPPPFDMFAQVGCMDLPLLPFPLGCPETPVGSGAVFGCSFGRRLMGGPVAPPRTLSRCCRRFLWPVGVCADTRHFDG